MNDFLQACGIARPLQLAIRGSSAAENGLRLLHQPFALVGRDPRAEVPLDHKLVSRRHAYLQIVAGRMFWHDLDSRAGTSVQGVIRRLGWLEPGQAVQVGPFEIAVMSDPGQGQSTGPAMRPALSPLIARTYENQVLPEVTLEFLNGPSRSACWPMNRVMSLIGSASGCKFRLADPSVSPFHCSLLRTPAGLWAVDLFGLDGITVNDALVRYTRLQADDVLGVGRYRIRLRIRYPELGPHAVETDIDRRFAITDARPAPRRFAGASLGAGGLLDTPASPPHSWQLMTTGVSQPLEMATSANSTGLMPQIGDIVNGLHGGPIAESVLGPLMSQFGQMQQEMLDQFQQAVTMLVQMFGTMHRDQMATIRDELDQLRDLTREMQEIKLELVNRSGREPATELTMEPNSERPRPVPKPFASNSFPADPRGPGFAKSEAIPGPSSLVTDRQSVISEGISAVAENAVFVSHEAMLPAVPEHIRPTRADEAVRDSFLEAPPVSGPAGNRPTLGMPRTGSQARTDRPQRKPGDTAKEPDQEVMVWLHQRMMVLQKERESRWKKIVKLLPGAS